MFLFCLVLAMSLCASVYMCFVVTCWERADILALVCSVCCEFVTFPLGQVWYLIVSIPDLCTLTYYDHVLKKLNFELLTPSPGSRGLWSAGKNICYNVAAFVILFNLIYNMTMSS